MSYKKWTLDLCHAMVMHQGIRHVSNPNTVCSGIGLFTDGVIIYIGSYSILDYIAGLAIAEVGG